MLPLAHTYVSTKAANRKNPLLILGSILPDIATTSSQQIGRDMIHNSPVELFNFIKSNYPALIDLGWGVRLHSQVNRGADFYTDDFDTGYAYIYGREISKDVAILLSTPHDQSCLVLAHNFIELAIDLHLAKSNKQITDAYKLGIENSKKEFATISECLGNYLSLDSATVSTEIDKLVSFLDIKNIESKELAIKKLILPLIKLRYKNDVSEEKALEILDKALELTEPTYQDFLDKTVIEVRKNILG